jgi:NAD(P)-dependent dehydrogenase (short-subunit alcohol dehydrogenase family)
MPDKTLLVTGASRGIGRAYALLAAQNGWAVGVNYREDAKSADAIVETIARAAAAPSCSGATCRSKPMRLACSTQRPRRLGP